MVRALSIDVSPTGKKKWIVSYRVNGKPNKEKSRVNILILDVKMLGNWQDNLNQMPKGKTLDSPTCQSCH